MESTTLNVSLLSVGNNIEKKVGKGPFACKKGFKELQLLALGGGSLAELPQDRFLIFIFKPNGF